MALSLRDHVLSFYPVMKEIQALFAANGTINIVLTGTSRLAAAKKTEQVRVYKIYKEIMTCM